VVDGIAGAHLVDEGLVTKETDMDVHGKVAVITGGGSGIGRATALRLARAGASIVAADIDAAGAADTVARITAAGGAAAAVHADVSNEADARRMLAFAEERFGGIDILHNNAGITCGPAGYPGAPPAQWQRVLDVNLQAVILGTQLALPALRKRGGGVIIHTASMAAFVGFPPDPVYAATKAAVVLFTHSLGGLAAEGIRVNCVCPGLVNTPMLTRHDAADRPEWLDRVPMLQAEDIADGVFELITNDALAGRAMRIMVGARDFAPLPEFPVA
jgi:NAD(P)-dependent dehydrogenase (short-subunit alcohol dehydrogenase family)